MSASLLPLVLLASTALTASTVIGPWFLTWQGSNSRSDSLLQTVFGDARRLFSNHFYAKADAYFHNGYYPGMFDVQDGPRESHLTASVSGDHHEDGDYLGPPRDWIEAFGRHFFPSEHSHLGEGHEDCDHCKDHGHDHGHEHGHGPAAGGGSRPGDEREMLPWLKLSAELDPHRVETYVVTAYWLRTGLKQVDEAEQFLRHGLRQNPGDCDLLFELGRIQAEDRKDVVRARNIWELALKNWGQLEPRRQEEKVFLRAQILGQLAKLEESAGHPARAMEHLAVLQGISPNPQSIQKWIDELKAKSAPATPAP
jgi:tetratricopeptide (TPR) repeat protein